MSSDPKHPSDPTRKQAGAADGDSPAIRKAPGLTTGEPERREFSDRSAGDSKHRDSTRKQAGAADGDNSPSTKAPGLRTGEPERREFSDKSGGASKRADSKDSGSAKPKVQGMPAAQRDSSGGQSDTNSGNAGGGTPSGR